jgi:hypothetical protein
MPVLDSLVWRTPRPIDAEVRLIQTSTGQETELNDSLFTFQKNFYAWNFWTTLPMEEGEEYKLIAEDSEGNRSTATFQMPQNFPYPNVEYSYRTETGWVRGSGVDTLVVADAIYDVKLKFEDSDHIEYGLKISHLEDVNYDENGNFEFSLNDKRTIASKFNLRQMAVEILRREVEVVSGNEDWPDVVGLVKEEIVLPNINSNVDNGMGVVMGIVSRRVRL